MKDFFDIVTLHDCADCNNKRNLGMKDAGIITVIANVIGALYSIFGQRPSAIEKDNFLNSLVAASQAMGFVGFDKDDVLHLMPSGWGEPSGRQNAAIVFDGYLQNMKALPVNTNLISYLNWGGGYMPSHPIYFTGKNQYTGSIDQASVFGEIGIVPLLLIGGLAYLFLSSPTKKKRVKK